MTTDVSSLLADLVRVPTQQATTERGPGNERVLCDLLVPMLRARGADEVIVAESPRTDGSPGAYVFARWGTPRRVINAHVDTVPANAGWSRDPWDAHITDGKLYGLGSADTKGAIAATLVALEGAVPRDRGVLFSGDEEAGSRIMEAFLATPLAAPIEEVIVCEPTARVGGIAHRGILAQTATLRGPGGHSSKADHLPKPLASLARLAVALDDAAKGRLDQGPRDPALASMRGTCLNIASLAGGVAFNVIPARGELGWSIRPYPGFDRAAWDHEVATLARAIDPAIVLETTLDNVPFACTDLVPLVERFVDRVGPLDFWTEAALWAQHGKKAIVIGPGDIGQAHAADEFVTVADLAWAVDLFRACLA